MAAAKRGNRLEESLARSAGVDLMCPVQAFGETWPSFWKPALWVEGLSTNGGPALWNPKYPSLRVTPDYAILFGGEEYPLECKTSKKGPTREELRLYGCKPEYYAQVQAQMLVCEKSRALLAFAELEVDEDERVYRRDLSYVWIDEDKDYQRRIVDAADRFVATLDREHPLL